MTNRAELRRLAEAAPENIDDDWMGLKRTEMRAALTPSVVLSLLDECERLQATCDGLDRQNDAIAEEIGKVAAERDAALAELECHRASRIAYASEFAPDAEGDHDVGSIHENIRKLKAELEACRKDAERYRWLRQKQTFIWLIQDWFPGGNDITDVDAEIDAAMSREAGHA